MAVQLIKDLIAYKIKFGRAFERELRRIIELDQMSKAEILELKSQEFVKQYRNAFSNASFYKELYQKHGLHLDSVKDLSDLSKLPIISKLDVRENANRMLAKSRLCVLKLIRAEQQELHFKYTEILTLQLKNTLTDIFSSRCMVIILEIRWFH